MNHGSIRVGSLSPRTTSNRLVDGETAIAFVGSPIVHSSVQRRLLSCEGAAAGWPYRPVL